jgi:maltose phosphorylase
MRVRNGNLHFNPFIPDQWKSYSFRLEFRKRVIKVKVSKEGVQTVLEAGEPIEIIMNDKSLSLKR